MLISRLAGRRNSIAIVNFLDPPTRKLRVGIIPFDTKGGKREKHGL